jgi:hypothetical protein
VASLNAQLKISKNDFDKLKFARDAYTIGRHPSIKDGLGFQREAKNLTSQRVPIPNKEKGKAPMASSSQKNHDFMYHDRKFSRNVHHDRSYNAYDSNACLLQVPILMVGLGEILCLMLLGKCVVDLPLCFMLAMLNSCFHAKIKR